MEFINKDWLVIAGFLIPIVSIVLIYFLGDIRKLRKYVAIALVLAIGLMILGSR